MTVENKPSLRDRISRMIGASGPMPLAEYMLMCLGDHQQGYYSNRTAFGKDGDFITAPEISQIFGELIGIWCVAMWQALGSPSRFSLVEAGPGNGTMMADMLRAVRGVAGFVDAAQICMIETAPRLVAIQKQQLGAMNVEANWCGSIDAVGNWPIIMVANEFLDALPVRQFVKTSHGWRERCVDVDRDGRLIWVIGAGLIDPTLLPGGADEEKNGAVFEYGPAREANVTQLACKLNQVGGAGLLVDYGYMHGGFGDTFQALQAHKPVNPLWEPGLADLTAHVDFTALKRAGEAQGAIVSPVVTQREFLLAMGLKERAERLISGKPEAQQRTILASAHRLCDADQMGRLFKVLAIGSTGMRVKYKSIPPF